LDYLKLKIDGEQHPLESAVWKIQAALFCGWRGEAGEGGILSIKPWGVVVF